MHDKLWQFQAIKTRQKRFRTFFLPKKKSILTFNKFIALTRSGDKVLFKQKIEVELIQYQG